MSVLHSVLMNVCPMLSLLFWSVNTESCFVQCWCVTPDGVNKVLYSLFITQQTNTRKQAQLACVKK